MASASEEIFHVWTRLVRAHTCVLGTIERALTAADLPALEWYDVLWELEKAGNLRPRDIQARLLLAQCNLSRLLDRMVAHQVVERCPCPDDRRGQIIAITPAGRRLRREMWPAYSNAMTVAVGEKLSAAEAEMLCTLLLRLRGED